MLEPRCLGESRKDTPVPNTETGLLPGTFSAHGRAREGARQCGWPSALRWSPCCPAPPGARTARPSLFPAWLEWEAGSWVVRDVSQATEFEPSPSHALRLWLWPEPRGHQDASERGTQAPQSGGPGE